MLTSVYLKWLSDMLLFDTIISLASSSVRFIPNFWSACLKYKFLWDSKLSISTQITYLKSEGEISPSLSASKILKAAVQTSSLDSFTVELEWISFWLLVTAWPSIINVTNSKKSTLISLILDGMKRRCHHRASSFPSIFNHLKWNLSWPFPSWSSFFMNSLLASLLICIFSKAVSTSSQVMLPLNDHVLHCNLYGIIITFYPRRIRKTHHKKSSVLQLIEHRSSFAFQKWTWNPLTQTQVRI